MFACLQEVEKIEEVGALEADVDDDLMSPDLAELVRQDDAQGLEAALKKETEQPNKRYQRLLTRLFHFACDEDSPKCCEMLLTSSKVPTVRLDVVSKSDGRSALHHGCSNLSTKCIDVLLKYNGARLSMIKSHAGTLPLEEALLTSKLDDVELDCPSPALIVERIGHKDLSAIQALLPFYKEQMSTIALKLLKELKVVPLVALLFNAGHVVNGVAKRTELQGTLVDLLLSRILPASVLAKPVEVQASQKKCIGSSDATWKPEAKKSSSNDKQKSNVDSNEKPKSKLTAGKNYEIFKAQETRVVVAADDRALATKLLECVLLFRPRLTAHPQSSFAAPLTRACQANDDYIVSILLAAGAPVNEQDSEGNTALHWTLRLHHLNLGMVRRLLGAGANVMQRNRFGATPAHTAAGHGHHEALSSILQRDLTGVNMLAATRETPLHYAALNNHIACAAILLKHGANRNVCNSHGLKPCHLAPSQEMYALLCADEKTLKSHSWQMLTELFSNSPAVSARSSCPSLPEAKLAVRALKRSDVDVKKVFVGGLPPEMTSDDLREEFEYDFGEVADATVLVSRQGATVRSRGFGFVVFKKEEDAIRALKRHHISIMGKKVEIKATIPEDVSVSGPATERCLPEIAALEKDPGARPAAHDGGGFSSETAAPGRHSGARAATWTAVNTIAETESTGDFKISPKSVFEKADAVEKRSSEELHRAAAWTCSQAVTFVPGENLEIGEAAYHQGATMQQPCTLFPEDSSPDLSSILAVTEESEDFASISNAVEEAEESEFAKLLSMLEVVPAYRKRVYAPYCPRP